MPNQNTYQTNQKESLMFKISIFESLKLMPGGELLSEIEEKLEPEEIGNLAEKVYDAIIDAILSNTTEEISKQLQEYISNNNFEAFNDTINYLIANDPIYVTKVIPSVIYLETFGHILQNK